MAGKDRLNLIRDILMNQKSVNVSVLSEQFNVTEETIRRDLGKLAEEGLATRTYGGAVLNTEANQDGVHFLQRMSIHEKEKRAIALKVLPMLEGKYTIAADSSSTVMEVLQILQERSDVTVLTNSVVALHELMRSQMTVVSTGGILNKRTMSLQGAITSKTIEEYSFDVLLMSCKGLDKERGAVDSNEIEASIKLAMIKHSAQVILLVDSTKFDRSAFFRLADLKHIDYLVTEKKPEDEWIRLLQDEGINLIY